MKTVEVEIFGQKYVVRGDSDPECVRRAAQCVDEKMREIASTSQGRASDRLALLAALNIADELFRLRTEQEHLDQAQSAATQKLIELIETDLQTLRPD